MSSIFKSAQLISLLLPPLDLFQTIRESLKPLSWFSAELAASPALLFLRPLSFPPSASSFDNLHCSASPTPHLLHPSRLISAAVNKQQGYPLSLRQNMPLQPPRLLPHLLHPSSAARLPDPDATAPSTEQRAFSHLMRSLPV